MNRVASALTTPRFGVWDPCENPRLQLDDWASFSWSEWPGCCLKCNAQTQSTGLARRAAWKDLLFARHLAKFVFQRFARYAVSNLLILTGTSPPPVEVCIAEIGTGASRVVGLKVFVRFPRLSDLRPYQQRFSVAWPTTEWPITQGDEFVQHSNSEKVHSVCPKPCCFGEVIIRRHGLPEVHWAFFF